MIKTPRLENESGRKFSPETWAFPVMLVNLDLANVIFYRQKLSSILFSHVHIEGLGHDL